MKTINQTKNLKAKQNIDYKRKLLYLLIALAIAGLASLPALRSGTIKGHDLPFHFGRIQSIAEALKSGQFPVRYEANAWYGHGYVSSLFYGHLCLYVPAILYMTGLPVFRAYNIYVILVNIATVLVAYYSFKRILKDDSRWGMLAAGIYTISSYRLSNLYVRAAVGEYTAMIFIPLVMLGIYQIYEIKDWKRHPDNPEHEHIFDNRYRNKINFKEYVPKLKTIYKYLNFPLIIGVTGIIESHILSTELVAMFVIFYMLFFIKRTIKLWKPILVNGVVILGVNLYFLVPFLASYKSMDLYINSKKTVDDLTKDGLYLRQVFKLLVGGYGSNHEFSFEEEAYLGLGILIVLALLFMLIHLIISIKNKSLKKQQLVVGFLGILACYFSTMYFPWSIFAQENAISKLMTSVQYPSRYLMLATAFFCAVGVNAMMEIVEYNVKIHHSKVEKVVEIHSKGETVFSFYVNKFYMRLVLMIAVAALATTAYFDYTLIYHNPTLNNVDADEKWADKLYLPLDTDAAVFEKMIVPVVDEKKSEVLLPVTAYENLVVCDTHGNEYSYVTGENNQMLVQDSKFVNILATADGLGFYVKYREPWYWRMSEIVSLGVFIGLILLRYWYAQKG